MGHELAEVFARLLSPEDVTILCDPVYFGGTVDRTIGSGDIVETSPDLRHARVFVSVLGSDTKRAKTLAGLAAAHGVLQARLARELRMKRTPQLEFEYDPTVERGVRMVQVFTEGNVWDHHNDLVKFINVSARDCDRATAALITSTSVTVAGTPRVFSSCCSRDISSLRRALKSS